MAMAHLLKVVPNILIITAALVWVMMLPIIIMMDNWILVTVDMLPPDEKVLKTYGSDENPDIYNCKT